MVKYSISPRAPVNLPSQWSGRSIVRVHISEEKSNSKISRNGCRHRRSARKVNLSIHGTRVLKENILSLRSQESE